MKTTIKTIITAVLAMVLLAACGVEDEDTPEPTPTAPVETAPVETEPVEPEETPEPSDATAENLSECLALLGKDDEAAKDALGGGEENIAGDGEALIGRIYSVELFGEQTEPSTAYDGSGKVSVVSIYLSGAESEPYYEKLVELYGEPDESSEGEASESGATWESWNINGAQLRLVQSYGLCTLELTAPSTAVG